MEFVGTLCLWLTQRAAVGSSHLTRAEVARHALLLLGFGEASEVDELTRPGQVQGVGPVNGAGAEYELARRRSGPSGDGPVRLTAAQTRVMELLEAGMRPQEIADALSTSVSTVRKHIAHAAQAMGVSGMLAATSAFRRLAQSRNEWR